MKSAMACPKSPLCLMAAPPQGKRAGGFRLQPDDVGKIADSAVVVPLREISDAAVVDDI